MDKDDVDYIENPDGAENAHKLFPDVNDVEGKIFFFSFEKYSKTILKKNNVSTYYLPTIFFSSEFRLSFSVYNITCIHITYRIVSIT